MKCLLKVKKIFQKSLIKPENILLFLGITKKHYLLIQMILCTNYLFLSNQSYAQIPEPGIIMYGQIHNESGELIQSGDVVLTLISETESYSIQIKTKVDEYKDEETGTLYSYYIQIPVGKEPLSNNCIYLTDEAQKFSRNFQIINKNIDYTDSIQLSTNHQGESILFSVCNAIDSDFDNLNDNWEMTYFGSLEYNGNDDNDSDLLINSIEQALMTDPTEPDTITRSDSITKLSEQIKVLSDKNSSFIKEIEQKDQVIHFLKNWDIKGDKIKGLEEAIDALKAVSDIHNNDN